MDLGEELRYYGIKKCECPEDGHKQTCEDEYTRPSTVFAAAQEMHSYGRLADLQAGGFKMTNDDDPWVARISSGAGGADGVAIPGGGGVTPPFKNQVAQHNNEENT